LSSFVELTWINVLAIPLVYPPVTIGIVILVASGQNGNGRNGAGLGKQSPRASFNATSLPYGKGLAI
jgi:hypothetical protein